MRRHWWCCCAYQTTPSRYRVVVCQTARFSSTHQVQRDWRAATFQCDDVLAGKWLTGVRFSSSSHTNSSHTNSRQTSRLQGLRHWLHHNSSGTPQVPEPACTSIYHHACGSTNTMGRPRCYILGWLFGNLGSHRARRPGVTASGTCFPGPICVTGGSDSCLGVTRETSIQVGLTSVQWSDGEQG